MKFQSTRDVIIQVGDAAAAKRFYGEVMGLKQTHDGAVAGFETGAFSLYVEPGPAPGAVFEFLVENPGAAKTRLLAAGCVIVEEDPAAPRCYLRDPFGLVFNLGLRRG